MAPLSAWHRHALPRSSASLRRASPAVQRRPRRWSACAPSLWRALSCCACHAQGTRCSLTRPSNRHSGGGSSRLVACRAAYARFLARCARARRSLGWRAGCPASDRRPPSARWRSASAYLPSSRAWHSRAHSTQQLEVQDTMNSQASAACPRPSCPCLRLSSRSAWPRAHWPSRSHAPRCAGVRGVQRSPRSSPAADRTRPRIARTAKAQRERHARRRWNGATQATRAQPRRARRRSRRAPRPSAAHASRSRPSRRTRQGAVAPAVQTAPARHLPARRMAAARSASAARRAAACCTCATLSSSWR